MKSERLGWFIAGQVLAGASCASAQISYQAVALSGQQAPGTGARYRAFSVPILNNAGEVAFSAWLDAGGGPAQNAVYAGRPGALQLVARQGDAAPGMPEGTTFGEPPGFSVGGMVVHGRDASGQILLSTWLTGPSCDPQAWALYAGRPGALELVVRQGQAAPGTAGATYSGLYDPTINDDGTVVFRGAVWGPTVTGKTSMGIWAGRPGAMQLAARMGEPAAALTGLAYVACPGDAETDFHRLMLADSGQILFEGFAATRDLESNNWAVWGGSPASLQVLAHAGDPAPDAGDGTRFTNLGAARLDRSGMAVMTTDLASADAAEADASAVYLGRPGYMRLSLRNGSPAPGLGDGAVFERFVDAAVNSSGQIAVVAVADGRMGLWAGNPDHLRLLALEGQPAPGLPDLCFESSFYGDFVDINDLGQVVFAAEVIGSGRPLWAADSTGGPVLLAREGGYLDIGSGNMRPVVSVADHGFSLNDAGQVAFTVDFGGLSGGRALFLATIPEPAFLPLLAGIAVLLPLRRLRPAATGPTHTQNTSPG